MKPFARIALAIAVFLALAGLASAQMPRADHRIYPNSHVNQQSVNTAATQSQWTPLTNQLCTGNNPCFPAGVTMLLTDGTVIVHEEQDGGEQNWYKLTPDAFGSYVNGTWSQVASIPGALNYAPLFFGSQVIADGRLTVIGGEYTQLIDTAGLDHPGRDLRSSGQHVDERTSAHWLAKDWRRAVDQPA